MQGEAASGAVGVIEEGVLRGGGAQLERLRSSHVVALEQKVQDQVH